MTFELSYLHRSASLHALLFLALFIQSLQVNHAQIGVCYGIHGNNLPSEQDVVNMYESKGITRMRLYEVDTNILQTLMGSGIELILEVPRASLPALASDPSVADQWIQTNVSPILVTIYPYFAYVNDPYNINLNYALFTALGSPVTDSNNGLHYQNIFDAMVDSVYAALGRAGAQDTIVVVAETGWPSAGGYGASFDNAGTYYRNLVSHSKNGTPKKPGKSMEVYLFSMLDQNLQAAGIEQNFGVFSSNLQPKYQLNFN